MLQAATTRCVLDKGLRLGRSTLRSLRCLSSISDVLPAEAQMVMRLLKGEQEAQEELKTLSKQQLHHLIQQLPAQMTARSQSQVYDTTGKSEGV
jgi:hypothetical protein